MVDLKIIQGGVVSKEEAAVADAKVVMINDDVTRMQLMTQRLLKAMGKKVKSRVTLSALACCVGKVFTVIPVDKHGLALHEFVNLVALAIRNEYTPEQQEQARQMALAAQKLKEEQDAKGGEPT